MLKEYFHLKNYGPPSQKNYISEKELIANLNKTFPFHSLFQRRTVLLRFNPSKIRLNKTDIIFHKNLMRNLNYSSSKCRLNNLKKFLFHPFFQIIFDTAFIEFDKYVIPFCQKRNVSPTQISLEIMLPCIKGFWITVGISPLTVDIHQNVLEFMIQLLLEQRPPIENQPLIFIDDRRESIFENKIRKELLLKSPLKIYSNHNGRKILTSKEEEIAEIVSKNPTLTDAELSKILGNKEASLRAMGSRMNTKIRSELRIQSSGYKELSILLSYLACC